MQFRSFRGLASLQPLSCLRRLEERSEARWSRWATRSTTPWAGRRTEPSWDLIWIRRGRGASGANNFYSLWLQFFLWFRAIFSPVPTHLTTGQLKILPLPWKNRRLAGAKHNRNSVTAGPALLEYTATPLTSSPLPLSCLYICCF